MTSRVMKVKFTETESRIVVARGKRNGELVFNGYRVLVWEDENSSAPQVPRRLRPRVQDQPWQHSESSSLKKFVLKLARCGDTPL